MYKNVLITATDTGYFQSCLILISHVQKNPAYDLIDQIVVYNLGMTQQQIDILNGLEKVSVREFPTKYLQEEFFPEYMDPKIYAWKLFALWEAKRYSTGSVFYLDAGIVPLRDFTEVYKIIEETGIFLVGSLHKIGEHITKKCKLVMGVTKDELQKEAITAGIQGYSLDCTKHNYWFSYIQGVYYWSQVKDAIYGPKYGTEPHRHDQTICSLRAHRLNLSDHFQDLYKYSGWKGPDMHPEQVFWVHRRNYVERNIRLKMKELKPE